MKPKISIVSLHVSDLGRALAFYREGLGFPTHNYADGDDFILFRLEGSWLSLHAGEDAPWGGYEAAFADPDGHVWDIAMNPFTDLT
jgi:predicted lactoylglutathione lyase